MTKFFKLISVITLLIANLIVPIISRFNRKIGGFLVFKMQEIFENSDSRENKNIVLVNFLNFSGCLLSGSPWEKIKKIIEIEEEEINKLDWLSLSFCTFFVDRKYSQAKEVALFWSEFTEQMVQGKEKDMEHFFLSNGTNISVKDQMYEIERRNKDKLNSCNNDSSSISDNNARDIYIEEWLSVKTYTHYYQSRLALIISTFALKNSEEVTQSVSFKIKVNYPFHYYCLPSFRITEDLAYLLGMQKSTVIEFRDEFMNSITSTSKRDDD